MSNLSSIQKNLIIGTCLGDGHIERNGKSRLRISHSEKQFALVTWKHSILCPHSLPIVTCVRYDKRNKKTYYTTKFDTKTKECFNEFFDLFYVEKKNCTHKYNAPSLRPFSIGSLVP